MRQEQAYAKYRCATCRRWWKPNEGSASYSCCVLHSPGECCHAFETEVNKKGWMLPVRPVLTNAIGGSPTITPRGVFR